MLEAITYGAMCEDIKNSKLEADTIGILFARPKSDVGRDIRDSLPYYHHRSGHNVNFYLPGYGAYWYGAYPDETDVVSINGTKWSFSNQEYAGFVADIESKSRWKYSGESELLLIDYKNGSLDFSNVLTLCLDAMLREDAIPSINIFFEKLFRLASEQRRLVQISDISTLNAMSQVTLECILDALPNLFRGFLKKGRHYIIRNCTK